MASRVKKTNMRLYLRSKQGTHPSPLTIEVRRDAINNSAFMKYLRISEVLAGMVCSADVTNKNAQLLIPANTRITDKHLRLMKAWGISELPILENEDSDSQKIVPINDRASETDLEERFIHCNSLLPAVKEMKRILISGEFLSEKP